MLELEVEVESESEAPINPPWRSGAIAAAATEIPNRTSSTMIRRLAAIDHPSDPGISCLGAGPQALLGAARQTFVGFRFRFAKGWVLTNR